MPSESPHLLPFASILASHDNFLRGMTGEGGDLFWMILVLLGAVAELRRARPLSSRVSLWLIRPDTVAEGLIGRDVEVVRLTDVPDPTDLRGIAGRGGVVVARGVVLPVRDGGAGLATGLRCLGRLKLGSPPSWKALSASRIKLRSSSEKMFSLCPSRSSLLLSWKMEPGSEVATDALLELKV
jgi:hypothetical protein